MSYATEGTSALPPSQHCWASRWPICTSILWATDGGHREVNPKNTAPTCGKEEELSALYRIEQRLVLREAAFKEGLIDGEMTGVAPRTLGTTTSAARWARGREARSPGLRRCFTKLSGI